MNTIIHFETIGCKLNQIETESSARFFADAGFSPRLTPLTASVSLPPPLFSVVNTCTVTAKAEQKARRLIRLLLAKFPSSPVLVTGCYAEVERAALRSISANIVVLPGSRKDNLADLPRYVLSLPPQSRETPSALLAHLLSWNPVSADNTEKDPHRDSLRGANDTVFPHPVADSVTSPDSVSPQKEHANTDALPRLHFTTCGNDSAVQQKPPFRAAIPSALTATPSPSADIPSKNADTKALHDSDAASNKQTAAIPSALTAAPSKSADIPSQSAPAFRLSTDTFLLHSRGSIKIQDGCSNSCAYCRIRIARGKSVSLSVNDVLYRVKQIEASGQREIVLTGVNLTLYHGAFTTKDGTEFFNFAKLLSYLLQNTARVSFRISSLYPEHVNDELCAVIKNARVRPHFHLSVQSGSDAVLCAMNRNYRARDVLNAVSRLRAIKPNAFFACDIIAGFPGETAEDFAETMNLCRACNFTWIHAFPFSPRPGTAAFNMGRQVPQRIAGERVKELTSFAKQSKYEYAHSFEDKTVRAVIEKRRRTVVRAVTENFLHVIIEGNYQELTALAGKEVRVRITKALPCNGNDDECEALAEFVSLCEA